MITSVPFLSVAMPEIVLISMACIILIFDVSVRKGFRGITYALVQMTLLSVFLLTALQYNVFTQPVTTCTLIAIRSSKQSHA